MSRRFFDALAKFWETFTYMSAMQGQPREKWMGPRESDFESVRSKLAYLESCWAGDPGDLERLKSLVEESISEYQLGNERAGTLAWKAADELQQNVRDRVYEARRLRASNDPEA
jgi:hypothetical protein